MCQLNFEPVQFESALSQPCTRTQITAKRKKKKRRQKKNENVSCQTSEWEDCFLQQLTHLFHIWMHAGSLFSTDIKYKILPATF